MPSPEVDALVASVQATRGAEDYAIQLLSGLGDYIRAHANDPAALRQLAADLDSKKDELGAAVAANPVPSDQPQP